MNITDHNLLDDFAGAHGIDPPSAVALMASVFNGVLGPLPRVASSTGMQVMFPFNIAIFDDDGTASKTIRSLLAPIKDFQMHSEERFGHIDPKVIKEGLIRLKEGLKEALEVPFSAERQLLRDYLELQVGGKYGRLNLLRFGQQAGLIPDDLSSRIDFTLRPRLLVVHPSCARIRDDVATCHRGQALIYGDTSLTLSDFGRPSGQGAYCLLGDARRPISSCTGGGWLFWNEEIRASWIFHGKTEDWRDPMMPRRLNNTFLLQTDPRSIPGKRALGKDSTPTLAPVWASALQVALKNRTWGEEQIVWSDQEEHLEFSKRHQAYLEDCAEAEVFAIAVEELPVAIYRLFLFLSDFGKSKNATELTADLAFQYAEILRERHLQTKHRLEESKVLAETIETASALMKRIREKEPVRLRALVRTFDKQKIDLYLPTLKQMAEVNLIVEDPFRTYRVGGERDLEGALRRRLA